MEMVTREKSSMLANVSTLLQFSVSPGLRNSVVATVLCGALVLAGWSGYVVGTLRRDSGSFMSALESIPYDVYLTERSFSEVENAKAKLDALRIQFLSDLRVRHSGSIAGARAGRSPSAATGL